MTYTFMENINGLYLYKTSSGFAVLLNPHKKLADFPTEAMAQKCANSFRRPNTGH